MERGVAPKTANTRNLPDIRRRLAGQSQATPRKRQEEGFTRGLPAHNARMFRHEPAPAVGTLLSRGMAVDNLWITMGLIHNPRIRVLRAVGGVLVVPATLPSPMPGKRRHGPGNRVDGDSPDEENPAHGGAIKKPPVFPHGGWLWVSPCYGWCVRA